MKRGIKLNQGEMITCENDHPFGRVMCNCEAGKGKGDWISAIDWLQYIPSAGGSVRCACGARWILILSLASDPTNKRARIHVGTDWRNPLDDIDRKHLADEKWQPKA